MQEMKTDLRALNGKPGAVAALWKRILQVMIGTVLQALVLFLSSGRLGWLSAWAYLAVYAGLMAFNMFILLPRNPELMAERARMQEGTKAWDRVLVPLVGYSPLLYLLVAGLDERFGWSLRLAAWTPFVALLLVALGYGLGVWVVASNPFFSGTVRIQMERGHTVVSTGPYRYVRHPGYVGTILYTLATPLLLGSLWALVPAGLTTCLVVVRTALEDKTLRQELDGYEEYACQVRYRLLPGIW